MKTFETFKDYIVTKAKELNACEEQFEKAYKAENYQELLKVITDNASWCYNNKLVNTEILANIPNEELVEANIYVNKQNVIQKEGLAYYYSSTSKHYGSSTSEHYGSSTSEHYDSSTSKHYGSSTSEHYGSSYATQYKINKESVNDSAIVREFLTGNVYFKKDAFNIIEL